MHRVLILLLVAFSFGWWVELPVYGCTVARCRFWFQLHNSNRWVGAAWLDNECGGDGFHDPPFGNWGVDSGWGDPSDGNQFQGWKQKFSLATFKNQWHWNSCTSNQVDYPFGDPNYYNDPPGEYWPQLTTKGLNKYTNLASKPVAVSCPLPDGWTGGCADLPSFDLPGEWLDAYELDPGQSWNTDPDAFVDRLYVDSLSAWPLFCDAYSCSYPYIYSFPSLAINLTYDIVADVYMQVISGEFEDPFGFCQTCEPFCGL